MVCTPVVKPNFQVFSLSSKATNRTRSHVVSCSVWVALTVMGFLLHAETIELMEQQLTNSGPVRESADKYSIYPLFCIRICRTRFTITDGKLSWITVTLPFWISMIRTAPTTLVVVAETYSIGHDSFLISTRLREAGIP